MRKLLITLCSLVMAGVCLFTLVLVADREKPTVSGETNTSLVADRLATVETTRATEVTQPAFVAIDPPDMSQTTARQLFVYDVLADRMLFTMGDQEEIIFPASLTKLFTAYVALQYLDPSQMVTVGEEAGWIEVDSSVAAVSEGCRLSAGMILQGMLMQSGNDAAYAIAVAAGREILQDKTAPARDGLSAFVGEMDRQLRALGLENTHFINPDGYHDDDHYSTAEDLLKIAKLALGNPVIMEYCGIASAAVRYDSGEEYTWKNSNYLLHEVSEFYCPEATGMKTGTTSRAGNCLIASFDTGSTVLLVGVLGCADRNDRFADAVMLFEHYRQALSGQ